MFLSDFAGIIIRWYHNHFRKLPWRYTHDPYKIWLSEIILQQTRVAQGLPYYERFVNEFPTIYELANAKEDHILSLWQGLGYYSRARNLHFCAKQVVEYYNGVFPGNYKDLLKLKGIGPYTAAAVASFAFNEKVPVLDGNVFRVLSRVFGIEKDILSTEAKKDFNKLAEKLISHNEPGLYNQAIMEFGAIQCTPNNPDCESCPVQQNCYAYKHQMQNVLPVKRKKPAKKTRYFNYFVFKYKDRFFTKRRASGDIWEGLYDFYLIETSSFLDWESLKQLTGFPVNDDFELMEESEVFSHQLTHQNLKARFFVVELESIDAKKNIDNLALNGKWVSMHDFQSYGKPILIEKYFKLQKI